jgi:hypothetical protein
LLASADPRNRSSAFAEPITATQNKVLKQTRQFLATSAKCAEASFREFSYIFS